MDNSPKICIYIQNISKFSSSLPTRRLPSEHLPESLHSFRVYFFFAGARQKVDNIHRAIFFAFQFLSVIRLFPSFDNLNSFAIIFSVHSRTMIARLPLSYPERSFRF